MAFVNESISEEDQQRIHYSALKDPHGNSLVNIQLPRWTVDHTRDIFLLPLGGGLARQYSRDGIEHKPFHFLFSWQGVWMRVDAFKDELPSNDSIPPIVIWEVIRIHRPETLPRLLEDVMQLLAEAFDARGSNSYDDSRALFIEICVDFSKLQIAKSDFAYEALAIPQLR